MLKNGHFSSVRQAVSVQFESFWSIVDLDSGFTVTAVLFSALDFKFL